MYQDQDQDSLLVKRRNDNHYNVTKEPQHTNTTSSSRHQKAGF